MTKSLIILLGFALLERVQAFSLPCLALSAHQRVTTTSCRAEKDEYDDWYAEFDPSSFANTSPAPISSRRGGNHDYQRDTSQDASAVDVAAVDALLAARLQCRRQGRFDEADAIRDQLLDEHGVRVLDREKMWRSGCSRSGSGKNWGRPQRTPKPRRTPNFGPNGHDYSLSADAGPNSSGLDETAIHQQIAQRLQHKLDRSFAAADAIQNELSDEGVYIHDGLKEWRADGIEYGDYSRGGKPGRTSGSNSDRDRPYQQAPDSLETDYVEQIESLLEERTQAKKARSFNVADNIRQDLMDLYNVAVDDRLRLWSVGGNFGRRESKPAFTMATWCEAPDNAEEIQALVEERDAARKERDFATADDIRDQLLSMNVKIDEKRRIWFVEASRGAKFNNAPRLFQRRGGGSLTPEQEQYVNEMLVKRDQAKANKQFGKADSIREKLRSDFLIRIDDRSREWMVVTGEFVMAPERPINADLKSYIESQINERAVAKLNKDYDTADAIRDELMETYSVFLDDRVNEWRIEGNLSDLATDFPGDQVVESSVADAKIPPTNVNGSDFAAPSESEPTNGENVEDLESLKVDELKDRLREAGLPVSGRKAELIERLSTSLD